MSLPQLPEIPDELVTVRELVDRLRLLKLDDDFGSLDLYVGAAEVLIIEALVSLEQRIVAIERKAGGRS